MSSTIETLSESTNPSQMAMEAALKATHKMQEDVIITPASLPKDALLMSVLKSIPLLTGLLGSIDTTTSTIGGLVQATGKAASGFSKASDGLHYAGLALNIVNFIRIPCIYLAAGILGQKPPIKLSNNAKWLYSAVLLAIAIVALTVPVTAPFMAITAAAISLGVGVLTLGRLLYQRQQHKQAIRELTAAIADEEKILLEIKSRALFLETDLRDAIAEQDDVRTSLLLAEISVLDSRYEQQQQALQTQHDARFIHLEKLKKKNMDQVMDKSVAVVLGAVGVIGVVVSIFFPPIGLAVLTGACIAGLLYTIGRITAPLFLRLGNWIIGQFNHKSVIADGLQDNDAPELGNNALLTATRAPRPDDGVSPIADAEPGKLVEKPVSSTAITALMLSGKQQAASDLREQIRRDEWVDKIESRLGACVRNHDAGAMLMIIRDLAGRQFAHADIVNYLDNFKTGTSPWPKGLELLHAAIDKVADNELKLSPEDVSTLLSSDALNAILLHNNLDMQRLIVKPDVVDHQPIKALLLEEAAEDSDGETEGDGGKRLIK